MTIHYNASGDDRKRLVQTIAELLECDAQYLGAPTFSYRIDCFTVDKDGSLHFDDRADSEVVECLIECLAERGFKAESSGLVIRMPKSTLEGGAMERLRRIVEAKGNLIEKAFGVGELPIVEETETVSFPWFVGEKNAEEVRAYSRFLSALCEMARNAKRITARERDVENEKYAFRTFLLRLGFIGDEFKQDRKILLRNFSGSSAFSGRKKEYAPGCDPIPTPENTVPFDVEEAKERLQDPEVQEEIRAILNGEDGAEQ